MLPEIKIHKGKSRYYIRVRGKFIYLGPWKGEKKPPVSIVAKYHDYIRTLIDPSAPTDPAFTQIGDDITVLEAVDRFLAWRLEDYGHRAFVDYDTALRPVVEQFGTTAAKDFGSLRLEQVRQNLVKAGRTRSGINVVANRTKTVWKWLVSRELVPPDTYAKLKALGALKAGHTAAPEAPRKTLVSLELAEQTALVAGPVLATMIRVQVLTGMRPGEVCSMTLEQIDQKNPTCWLYKPHKFKTAHLGKNRIIPLGPKAIGLIAPFIEGKLPTAAIFSPIEATAYALRKRAEEATSPSRYDRSIENPTRPPGEFYCTLSYGRAIARLCDRHKITRWSPSCLRATKAQAAYETLGLESAKTLLGHMDAGVTERHYLRESEEKITRLALLLEDSAQPKTPSYGG